MRIHIINISNCTIYIAKFFTGFDTLFWPILKDFQNEAADLCVNNSINKTEAMEAVLWLVKRV